MAHRGRLNVLANVMGKPYRAIFHEFEGGSLHARRRRGLGRRQVPPRLLVRPRVRRQQRPPVADRQPVAPRGRRPGRARQGARQAGPARRHASARKVLPLLIHGDAAFAGQGVVAECFGLSGLHGLPHRRHDPLHRQQPDRLHHQPALRALVALPVRRRQDDRGADLPRQRRRSRGGGLRRQARDRVPPDVPASDVVIDMFCYRRFGHNEGDEPLHPAADVRDDPPASADAARSTPSSSSPRASSTEAEVEAMQTGWRAQLEDEFEAGQAYQPNKADWLDGALGRPQAAATTPTTPRRGQTGVAAEALQRDRQRAHRRARRASTSTARIAAHPRQPPQDDRDAARASTGRPPRRSPSARCCVEGYPVRLSGQDVERGTFSQRHAVLIDQETEARYMPLNHIARRAGAASRSSTRCSPRRRCSASSTATRSPSPNALVLWEAQFGDFANGAQVDHRPVHRLGRAQVAAHVGPRLLLPHGYEGQGPEHSSARLERFLQLCAEDNMQVANCTTPAKYFHILRRQMQRDFRKPLIVMTPKSLLRHKRAVSPLDELGRRHDLPPRALGRRPDRARADQARAGRRDQARRAVLGQGLLRPARGAREARRRRRRPDARRAALSVPAEGAGAGARRASASADDGLVPGGAAEHGRLDLRRARLDRAAVLDRGRAAQPQRPRYARPRRPSASPGDRPRRKRHAPEQARPGSPTRSAHNEPGVRDAPAG